MNEIIEIFTNMRAQFTPISKEQPPSVGESGRKLKTIKLPLLSLQHPVVLAAIAVSIALALVLLGAWIARRPPGGAGDAYTKLPGQAASIAQLSEKQVKELVVKVNKHIMLPPETPQIVAIANVDQLKVDQPFFRTAQNGDQLLVYPSRVILYRPSTDQVVDVAQIRANAQQGLSQSSASAVIK